MSISIWKRGEKERMRERERERERDVKNDLQLMNCLLLNISKNVNFIKSFRCSTEIL